MLLCYSFLYLLIILLYVDLLYPYLLFFASYTGIDEVREPKGKGKGKKASR